MSSTTIEKTVIAWDGTDEGDLRNGERVSLTDAFNASTGHSKTVARRGDGPSDRVAIDNRVDTPDGYGVVRSTRANGRDGWVVVEREV